MGGYSNVYASGNGNGVCLKSAFRPYDPTEADFVMTAPLPPFTCYALPQVAKSSVVVATTEVFDPTQDLPSAYLDHWGWKTMLRWMEKIVRGLNERRLRHGRLYEEINQADTTWAHSTLKMAFDSSLVELESHLNTFDYAWSPEENRPKSRVFKPWDPSSH
ncbi:hypothetical protein LPJ53_001227 [Coemansia erecta]|uniref:Uncharacterized protein n=1 Tax=Coemansia erecta TaxID=147472 RepID=A0A9W7Y4S5_9FUNG|nr:hypothetical protein LPJ53_001227 [Coemansia erecta]